MSENKGLSVILVDELRENFMEYLEESECFNKAAECTVCDAYYAGSGNELNAESQKVFDVCRAAFVEKMSRTNDMDAAFVKMVWVAYKMGAEKS